MKMRTRSLFEGFEPPDPICLDAAVQSEESVGVVPDPETADALELLQYQTRRRDALCQHNPLPDEWPDGVSYFKGSDVRLCGIHVYYDFAWTDKFAHGKKFFADGQALAGFVQSRCPEGKQAALLLTVNSAISPGIRHTDKLYLAVVHIDSYLKSKQSPATAYFFSNIAADLETLQEVAKNPAIVKQILKSHIDVESITNWLIEDQSRLELLRAIVDSTGPKPKESVEALQTVVEKWSSGAISIVEVESLVGSLNDDAKLGSLISALAERSADLRSLPQLGQEDSRRMVAAALRASHRADALELLKTHVREDALEEVFQDLLDKNWWMLGTQYVELIRKRQLTVEEKVDLLLRSADGYFDIIELKRANVKLFIKDHDKWIVSADVNRVVNQTAHYIAEIEANRDSILRRQNLDLFKLHGYVIVGHVPDDEPDVGDKRAALRLYNSHLHRVTVLTYDELMRIAEQVVLANEGEVEYAADLAGLQEAPLDVASQSNDEAPQQDPA